MTHRVLILDGGLARRTDMLSLLRAAGVETVACRTLDDAREMLRRDAFDFVVLDPTAARELAETRAALADRLERKDRALEALSYSVSHDLRAPVRAVSGFGRLLVEDCIDQLDERGRGYLLRVCSAAKRLGEMIDGLLALARLEREELTREPVDLSSLAQQIVRALAERAPAGTVRVEVQERMIAEADRRLARMLLENLLGNAWKFTSKVPQPVVEIGVANVAAERVFFVRDNGVGFDPKYADKLFAPFQRMHGDDEFPGTGIGLAAVRRIADLHGGRVWAEAAPGKGATFFFTLQPS